jgi:UDP-N-acetylmuramate dehydrogenase
LIDEWGLKGERVGGAHVSSKHANFIINEGNATATDVLRLVDVIRAKVPVPLELEVLVW